MEENNNINFDPVKAVKDFLIKSEISAEIIHTEKTIFTVSDASVAVGAPETEILKSILLQVNRGEYIALALMSGPNRIDTKKIKKRLQASHVKFLDAESCYKWSGFGPGGVPPIGYPKQPITLIDEDLFLYKTIWSAGGTDHHFFPISPDELRRITNGEVVDIKK
jgi:prolyl-tRNA editing enzyme YbaK/EbsC (Cys-tRNA(Pro) deacylase)